MTKTQIRQRIEYFYHIWDSTGQASLPGLEIVQKHLRGLVVDDLFTTLPPLSYR